MSFLKYYENAKPGQKRKQIQTERQSEKNEMYSMK
jgi:hypothetical protein